MKVLVMGGSQFNGYSLVMELVKQGHEVTVLNRGRTAVDFPRAVRRLVADRTDHDQVRAVLGGESFDVVQDMSAYHPADVELMIEVFEGRVGHYIFASSTVIYAPTDILPITEDHLVDRGPNQNEYGFHKLLCEDILVDAWRSRGFPATIVPFSMVFGPRNILADREQRMILRLLRGRPVLVPGDGTTMGQVGHVDDQSRALRMMMLQPQTFRKRYNLTGGTYQSDEGYVDTFAEVLGKEADKVFIPASMMDDLWDGALVFEEGRASPVNIDIRSSDTARADADNTRRRFKLAQLVQRLAPNLHRWNRSVVFSVDRLRADVGWEPEYTLAGMVDHVHRWMVAEGLDRSLDLDFTFEDQIAAHVQRSR